MADDVTRRELLKRAVWAGAGAAALFYGAVAGDLLWPAPVEAAAWQDLGPLDKFPAGKPTFAVYTGQGIEDGLYVVAQSAAQPIVFDFHCPHLQCPVRWIAGAGEFACPCHGSTFNRLGQHTGGPAPHGLSYHLRQVRGGHLWVAGQSGHAGDAGA